MKKDIQESTTPFLLYKTANNDIKVDVLIEDETLWLNQNQIGELFSVQRPVITKHIKNIYESGELDEKSVSSIMEHTAKDNKIYKTNFCNLEMIIAVGVTCKDLLQIQKESKEIF